MEEKNLRPVLYLVQENFHWIWWTFGEHYRETKAGNDIKMAAGYPERIKEAYEKGFITEGEIRLSARRILNMILKID